MNHISRVETILYVTDQQLSTRFYTAIFRQEAQLNVPGMTEFRISDEFILGLMPCDGIAKILSDKTPHPSSGNGIPRCELYLSVADVNVEYENALQADAFLIMAPTDMDWGDRVCYFADPDGHILAFAQAINAK